MDRVYKRYTNQLKEGEDWQKPLSDDEIIELIRYHKARARDGDMGDWVDKMVRKTIQSLEHYLQIKDD